MANKLYRISKNDNIAVALEEIKDGENLSLGEYKIDAANDIMKGHKIALKAITTGESIIKYGMPIGQAVRNISAGEHVHIHNIKSGLKGLLEYSYLPVPGRIDATGEGTFKGYLRDNGDVGTRNEIWIINTVGCVNKTAELLAHEANIRFAGKTDGIYYFSHPFGCSQLGEDHEATQKILAGMVNHPNAAAALVLGLGCENNNIPEFKKVLRQYDPKRVRFLTVQEVQDEIGEGISLLEELVEYAASFKRSDCPLSKLKIGLKCGGSDGLSGITANPLVGNLSDMHIQQGGTSILTEVPEMFGAETILMNRCISTDVFDKTVELINSFKKYFISCNQEIYENPSPGNLAGGISTLEEKSLGCIQKGGNASVVDVLDYGERAEVQGLNLLKAPGNDMVAITALMAAGAQLILFTTGRGTPLGSAVPTVKVSSNTELYLRKGNWIDFDAGCLLECDNREAAIESFYQYMLKVASGELKTQNEKNGYREIAIFKNGVTL